jgi:hypothetical protein
MLRIDFGVTAFALRFAASEAPPFSARLAHLPLMADPKK